MSWQLAITLLFVLWAVGLLVRRAFRFVAGRSSGGCHSAGAGCSGCVVNSAQEETTTRGREFVSLDSLQLSQHNGVADRRS